MSSIPSSPPPSNEPTFKGDTAAGTSDPTPVLSAIGGFNLPTWGNEPIRLVILQGWFVSYGVQYYASLAVAAALPWVLGRPAVAWSALLVATQIGSGYLSERFSKKRGVLKPLMIIKANRTRFIIVFTLWVALVTTWAIGSARALGVPTWLIWIGTFLGAVLVVAVLIDAFRLGRAYQAHLTASSDSRTPTNGS